MPASGDLIGPYRLVSQLGKGAMGEVWRARDERLDRYVALKLLPSELADDPERRARMLREARAAAAIPHPNVVTLYDIEQGDTGDILVMELVEGRTLSDVLRKDGAPPLETGLRWIAEVAEALVAAHARRILHRDIKSANIMVTPAGAIKVLDFGLAKVKDEAAASMSMRMLPPLDVSVALDVTIDFDASVVSPVSGLDATLASTGGGDSYKTHAGSLLGTPLYMAPEQIAGGLPDERSEVFSVGVLAYEIIAGKSPYRATSMEDLFREITGESPPALASTPEAVDAIVRRALAKDPAERWPTMESFRDAIASERKRRFSPRGSRWPMAAILVLLVALAGGAVFWRLSNRTQAQRPGDAYVQRALEEYNVFYNDKALSSLRAALRGSPDHPRANAYMILFGGAPQEDRVTALAAAKRALGSTQPQSKDRALVTAAIAYSEQGAAAAKAALLGSGAARDQEIAFWAATLDWRSGNYAAARDGYAALLQQPARRFRGRIYDQYSSILLYFDDSDEALRIGTLYRDAFPGEADAVGVYATTLAAAGRYDEAVAAAEDALRLAEGEDTLAGLAKVLALRGDRARAKDLYQRSLERAGTTRRPIRRAALAFLHWIDGANAAARETVEPCITGSDATTRERGQCLWVAGLVDPERTEEIATKLDALAGEAIPTKPAYGSPRSLASLVRARARFFGGGCVLETVPSGDVDESAYDVPVDFYAAYHIPFAATWAACERAALRASKGDRAGARALLEPITARAPNRAWLMQSLARFK